jgi:hypothetical protein
MKVPPHLEGVAGEGPETVKKKMRFLKAYDSTLGNIKMSCQKANISRNTFYGWKENDEDFEMALTEVDQGRVDFVETKMMQVINKGDSSMIRFFLRTKAKDRGYTEDVVQQSRDVLSGLSDAQVMALITQAGKEEVNRYLKEEGFAEEDLDEEDEDMDDFSDLSEG